MAGRKLNGPKRLASDAVVYTGIYELWSKLRKGGYIGDWVCARMENQAEKDMETGIIKWFMACLMYVEA